MATVRMKGVASTEKASESVLRAGAETVTVVDERGRSITVVRRGPLHLYRLTKMLGDAGQGTLNIAMAAASVSKIDDSDVPFPVHEREIEATLQILDFDGMAAAQKGLEALAPADPDAEAAAAKN